MTVRDAKHRIGFQQILVQEGRPTIVWFVDDNDIDGYWVVGKDEIGVNVLVDAVDVQEVVLELVETLLHELIHWGGETEDEDKVNSMLDEILRSLHRGESRRSV